MEFTVAKQNRSLAAWSLILPSITRHVSFSLAHGEPAVATVYRLVLRGECIAQLPVKWSDAAVKNCRNCSDFRFASSAEPEMAGRLWVNDPSIWTR